MRSTNNRQTAHTSALVSITVLTLAMAAFLALPGSLRHASAEAKGTSVSGQQAFTRTLSRAAGVLPFVAEDGYGYGEYPYTPAPFNLDGDNGYLIIQDDGAPAGNPAPIVNWPITLSKPIDGYGMIAVTFDENAGIPDDVELVVSANSAEDWRKSQLDAALEIDDSDFVVDRYFYTISLVKGNYTYPVPNADVQVTLETSAIDPKYSDAVEGAFIGSTTSSELSISNFTGQDNEGVESTNPSYTSLSFNTGVLGEVGFAVVVSPDYSDTLNDDTIQIYGPRNESVIPAINESVDRKVEGYEGLTVNTYYSFTTGNAHLWDEALWVESTPSTEKPKIGCTLLYEATENGDLGALLINEAGTDEPVGITTNRLYALVWDNGLREGTLTDAGNEVKGSVPIGASLEATDVATDYANAEAVNGKDGGFKDDYDTIAAYALSVKVDGETWTAPDDADFDITISDEDISSDGDIEVWQVAGEGFAEVKEITVRDGSVSFTSEGIGTYILVERVSLEQEQTRTFGAYEVTATYDGEAGLPRNAMLQVKEGPSQGAEYLRDVLDSATAIGIKLRNVSFAKVIDISFVDSTLAGDTTCSLSGSVKVSVQLLDESLNADQHVKVVHEGSTTEVLDSEIDGNTFTFTITSCSPFVIVAYTDDPTYGSYTYTIGDETSITLSSLLDDINIPGVELSDIEDVVFSNDRYISVARASDGEGGSPSDDWVLTINTSELESFTTVETLEVRLFGGSTIEIKVVAQEAIAQVGNKPYRTLEAAEEAARDGDTIVLLGDAKGSISTSKELTLDLSGFTLTVEADEGIKSTTVAATEDGNAQVGNLTVLNGDVVTTGNNLFSAIGGTITLGENLNVTGANTLIYVTDGGKVVVDGAKLESESSDPGNPESSELTGANTYVAACATGNNSSIEIKSGSIKKSGSDNPTLAVDGGATATISGGTLSNTASLVVGVKDAGSSVTIEGGTITADTEGETKFSAAYAIDGGAMEISGGTITSTSDAGVISRNGGQLTVSGGTIRGASNAAGILQQGEGSQTTVSSGTIYGVQVEGGSVSITDATVMDAVSATAPGNLQVSGGRYENTVDPQYIVEGYECTTTKDSDGYYHIVKPDHIITITANSANKEYDASSLKDDGYTVTDKDGNVITELPDGDTLTVVVKGSITSVGEEDNIASGALIKNSQGEDVTSTYAIYYKKGTLEVTPKPVTVTVANAEKSYGEADPEFTATVEADGLIGDDTIEYELAREKAGTEEGEDVGTYLIAVAGEDMVRGNYEIVCVPGTFTISPLAVTVTITGTNDTSEYDGAEHSVSGYASEASSSLYKEADINFTGTASASRTNVGTTQMGLSEDQFSNKNDNFNVTFEVTDGYQTIEPRAVTIAADDKTKPYDNDTTTDPELTATPSNVVDGDTLSYSLGRAPGQAVGTYAIVVTPGENNNYVVRTEDGAFTITPRPLTITAVSDEKTYDGDSLSKYGYSFDPGDLVTGDRIDSVDVTGSQTNAGTGDNVASDAHVLNALGEDVTDNYAIKYVVGTLKVNPAEVKITIDNAEKVYGSSDPTFTASVSGLLPDDSEDLIEYGFARVEDEDGQDVGEYGVTATYEKVQGNYEITEVVNGILTITKATATVTADDLSKVYGAADPVLTATVKGLKYDDQPSVIGYALSRESGQEIGEYVITPYMDPEAQEPKNYEVNFITGTFNITKAKATVTAEPATKVYGDEDPDFKANVTGLQEGDDESVISYGFSREAGDSVGEYKVSPIGDVSQGNYDVEFVDSKLTITRATATVKAEPQTKVYGEEDSQLVANVYGLKNGDDESVITYALSREPGTDVGSYTITPSGEAEQGNYNVEYETSALTITRAPVTVSADADSKTYGTADPTSFTAEVEGLVNGESEELISYSLTRDGGEAVGSYAITATGEAVQGNYQVSFTGNTFTIAPRAITVSITGHNATSVFDSQPHVAEGYDVEITDADVDDLDGEKYAYKEEYIEFGGVAKTNPVVNVGSESMGLESEQFSNTNTNYEVTFNVEDGSQVVTPRPVTVNVTGENDTVNFDGVAHTVSGYDAACDDTLYDIVNVNYSGDASVSRTETGTSYMGLTADDFENEDNNFTVSFEVVDGFITISKIKINVRIVGNTQTDSYDGTEHTVSGYTAVSESDLFDPEKLTFTGSAEASRTEVTVEDGQTVDTTYMGLTKEDFDYIDSDVSAEFEVVDGYQRITKINAEVSITGNNDVSDYDGEAHTITGYIATADTVLFDVDSDIVFSGEASATQTNVGTSNMGLEVDQFSHNNPNFDTVTFVVEEDGYQTIRPITATVSIVGNNDSFVYDGQTHEVNGFTATSDSTLYHVEDDEEHGITKDFTFSGAAKAERAGAGVTNMNLSADQFENNNPNFSDVIFEIEDGFVEVTPTTATVTIVGHSETFTYDGEEHTASGYDKAFDTDLYDEDCFELITSGSDSVSRTEAGSADMNLGPDSFRNISPNFEDVTFEVTDGSITIDPAIVVSKYLNNVSATDPETFTFNVKLTNDEEKPIAGHCLVKVPEGEQSLVTNEDGEASLTISVAGLQTDSVTLDIPYSSSLWVEEDKTEDPNNYNTTINGSVASNYELDYVTDSTFTLAFENAIGNVCRIGEEEFQTISSALQWAQENEEHEVTIEMMVDYTMPATDEVVIPANYTVTLSTAADYEGEGAATITRAPGFIGPMFVNRGTLNVADEYPGTKVIIDGNGQNVTASSAVIENSATVNVCSGGTIQNANSNGNGGAIHSSGSSNRVNVTGGSLLDNRAARGGAIYSTGTVTASSGEIADNSATSDGGAVYTTEGSVTVTSLGGGEATIRFAGNMGANGGGIYSESGAVSVNAAITNNIATSGNGGAIYAGSGAVSIVGGTLAGNLALNGNGGAVFSGTGGVGVTGGVIGGDTTADANKALRGAAIYIEHGSGSFSAGRIVGNVTTGAGGAINVGNIGARLSFSASAYIFDNTAADGSARNVCLDQDTDLIINALGLSSDARVGVYVPDKDGLYEKRGVSGARFGGYTDATNLNAFKNDRTPGMTVSEDNFKMQWGKSIKVELRELGTFSGGSLPPTAAGTVKKQGDFFPTSNENYVSDIAADLMNTMGGIASGNTFACAFGKGATQYSECLTKVDWNNATGDWGFVNRAGDFVSYSTVPATLVIYYSAPSYVTVANNTEYPLDITSLTVNGINVNETGYGSVVARKGATVDNFLPIESSDLQLDPGTSLKYMFPGVRKKLFGLEGKFSDKTDENDVDYTYTEVQGTAYTTGTIKTGAISATEAIDGFAFSNLRLFNNTNTVEIALGESTKICKIVEMNADGTVKEEHLYPTIQEAVEDGSANYDDYKVSVTDEDGVTYDTVKVEMIQDYLMPATDAPNIPSGKNFTFTTAVRGKTQGVTVYSGEGERAVISQDQGNTNSFFRATVGGDGTALTIEGIEFEGKQLDATKTNGGVINTKDCSVTIRNSRFSNFSAGFGGAVYALFGTTDKSTYSNDNNWVKIIETDFVNCQSKAAQDKFGGGGVWTNAKAMTMSDCNFTSCFATQQGGAVYHRVDGDYAYTATSTTDIIGCKFEHCSANAAGGLEINAVKVKIDGCVFDDCQALTRNGGGFNAYLRTPGTKNTRLDIIDTLFNNCYAEQNGGVFRTMMNTYVTNCQFTDNTAKGNGGGIAQDNKNELLLNECTVTGNKSSSQGGGIYTNGNLTLENNCIITGNSLTTNEIANGAGVFLPDDKTLTLGMKDAPADFRDTCDISGNVTADGSASNLRLPVSGNVNANKVIVRCNFTTGENDDKYIHVLNANASGTQFGQTNGVSKPNGFKEREHIFVADNNDLYGVYDRTTGNKIVWNGLPICKITDENDNLLYFDQEAKDPAIFAKLDNASNNVDMDGAFSYLKNSKGNIVLYWKDGTETKRYNDNVFCVKMLIDEYPLNNYISAYQNISKIADIWQTIVFTTETSRDGLYPFRGNNDTSIIYRTKNTGNGKSLLYVQGTNVCIENIILDGSSDTITNVSCMGGVIDVKNAGHLVLDNGATIQNSKTSGKRGAGVFLEPADSSFASCEIKEGALIQNCVGTASDGQGGGYCQKGPTSLTMTGGTVRNCSSRDGGGVFINNGEFRMSGGLIENNTATNQGGAVAFGNWNSPAPTLYMSGGSMTNNHAANSGGAMTFVGTYTKLYFSGNPVVYDNTIGNSNTPCNVQLNQDNVGLINASGLGDSANIGIYTAGSGSGSMYEKHGVKGKDFGTWSDNAHLEMFVNDRDTDLRGAENPNNRNKIWWQKMQSLTVTKTVSGELPTDKTKDFTFTVTLEQPGVNQSFGSMEFIDSVATFTLRNGQTKKAVYLPTANISGNFTVEEAEDDDFSTTVNGESGCTYTGSFRMPEDIGDDADDLAHVANFVNTHKLSSLTVSKSVSSEQASDSDIEFSFRVVMGSNAIKGSYGDMNFSNGVATFTLKNGETKTANGLPSGVAYTITETANSNFNTSTTVNGRTQKPEGIQLVAGDNNEVVFTNTRKVGGLKLMKSVVSDATADKDLTFPISVTLTQEGVPVNATYPAKDTDDHQIEGGVQFINGVYTANLKHGQSLTIEKLPQGAVYNVTESVSGFTTRYAYTDASGRTDNTRTIGGETVTCSVTNTRATGRLQVIKRLVSDRSADATGAQFQFVVKLGHRDGEGNLVVDEGINKTYSSVVFTNGESSPFTITGANSKTITGLPQGIDYEVTELERDKFSLTDSSAATGTISGSTSVATFTNTRAVGDLKIEKMVVSDAAADFDKTFTFTVRLGDSKISKTYDLVDENGERLSGINFSGGVATLSMKHGQSRTIVGLPTDVTYAITEAAVSGFTPSSEHASGTIVENVEEIDYVTHEVREVPGCVASFTNTRNVGDLTIRKTVSSDLLNGLVNDAQKEFTFTVQLGRLEGANFVVDTTIGELTAESPDGKTYGDMTFKNGVATVVMKHNESKTATGLPGDIRYRIIEQSYSDFTTVSSGSEGSITAGRAAVASFTNTRKTGSLVIAKTVVSDVSNDRSQSYVFDIKLGKTVVNEGVSEFKVDTTINKKYGSATFAGGEATISLKPSTGTISTTLSGLPQGIEYVVAEANTPIANMTTTVDGEAAYSTTGIIGASASRAGFTNTRDKGNLKVTKTLKSDLASDANVEFEFTVKVGNVTGTYSNVRFTNGTGSFRLKGGQSKTIEGLPAGLSYTVTETANSNFDTSKTGDKGTIAKDETLEVEYTNTRKTGDLRLTKRVVSDLAGDNDREFNFTVTLNDTSIGSTSASDGDEQPEGSAGKQYGDMTFVNGVATFTLKKDQSITAVGLPTTLGYTVTEEGVSGFTTTKTGDSGSIKTERSNAVFTNTRDTGDLTVKKDVVSDLATDANEVFGFKVTLGDMSIGAVTESTPNGKTFGGMTFKDGVAEFTLKGGESKTAKGLPAGITYTVEETGNDHFETTKSKDTGTVPTNKAVTASFTNTRKTASLEIVKSVESDLAADLSVGFRFTVTLTGLSDAAKNKTYSGKIVSDGSETAHDVQFRSGSATITGIKHGDAMRIEGLPTGAAYSVKETLNAAQTADYTTEPSSLTRSGTIVANTTETDDETGDEREVSGNIADFTNTRIVGDLVITKTLVSDLAADKKLDFPFTVTLSDTSIGDSENGKAFACVRESGEGDDKVTESDEVIFKKGVATVTIKGGEKLTIKGLPTDVRATVIEDLTSAQKLDFASVPSNYTRSATISVTPHVAAFTNTRKTGKLTVKKTLVSDLTADKDESFVFEISLGSTTTVTDDGGTETEEFVVDETLNKKYSDVTFASGKAEISLKGGESVTLEGLPTDLVYIVREKPTDTQKEGFVTEPIKVQGVISNTSTANANIKNTRKTGDLVVAKKIENGLTSDDKRSFTFTVTLGMTDDEGSFKKDEGINGSYGDVTFRKGVGTFTLTKDTEKTIKSVPAGMTYIVSENSMRGFLPVSEQTGTIIEKAAAAQDGQGAEDAQEDTSAKATFTNVRAVCKITDTNGRLLYEDAAHTKPAVYTKLDTEVSSKCESALYSATGAAYEGAVNLKMLVPEYVIASGVELGSADGRAITLTTASTADSDNYPYGGANGTASVISRGYDGASMFTTAGNVTLDLVTLDGGKENYASDSKGGIVNVLSGSLDVTTKATLRDSRAEAADGGGAIYMTDGVLNVAGTISGCETTGDGGAISAADGTVAIVGKIQGCKAIGGATKQEGITVLTSAGDGGAVKSSGASVTIAASAELIGNSTGTNGENLKSRGGAIYSSGPVTVSGGTISGNTAHVDGGGIYIDNKGSITMTGGTIAENATTVGNGGGIASESSAETNEITGGTISSNVSAKNGGGISVGKGKLSISGSAKLEGNSATNNGGAAYVTGGASSVLTVSGVPLTDNSASNGGAIYVNKGVATINNNATVSGNNATGKAGAVYVVNEAILNVDGASITGNESNTGAISVGGASAQLNFSGATRVADNKTTSGETANVWLDQNTNAIINTSGLSKSAYVGVYVTGDDGTEPYVSRGDALDDFGTYTGTSNLNLFVNDRNALTGAARTNDGKIVWMKVVPLEVTKQVTDKFGSLARTFTLSATFEGKGEEYSYSWSDGSETYTLTEGEGGAQSKDVTAPAGTKRDDSGSAVIGTATFVLPAGADVVLTETADVATEIDYYDTFIAQGAHSGLKADPVFNGHDATFGIDTSSTSATLMLTNERKLQSVTIAKSLVDTIDESRMFSFLGTVTDHGENVDVRGLTDAEGEGLNKFGITATAGEAKSVVFSEFPVGASLKVSEDTSVVDEGTSFTIEELYETESAVSSDYSDVDDSKTVVEVEAVTESSPLTMTFTNTRKTGTLKVSKSVESDLAADHTRTFDFTVEMGSSKVDGTYGEGDDAVTFTNGVATLSLTDAQEKTITGLPAGVSYEVAETAATGFVTTDTGNTGRVSATPAFVAFTNSRNTGDLTVEKEVVSELTADVDREFEFTVMLDDKTIGAVTEESPDGKTYGDMTFKDGVATFTLKGGEDVIAKGLPTTVGYTVIEKEDDDFITTSEGASGSVTKDGSIAVFTNTRKTVTLVLIKDWLVDNDPTKSFESAGGASAVFNLYQRVKEADGTWTDLGLYRWNGNDSITLTSAEGWTMTLAGLPGYDEDERLYGYYVKEIAAEVDEAVYLPTTPEFASYKYGNGDTSGDDETVGLVTVDSSDNTVTVTNRIFTVPEKTEFVIRKAWEGEDSPDDLVIDVAVYLVTNPAQGYQTGEGVSVPEAFQLNADAAPEGIKALEANVTDQNENMAAFTVPTPNGFFPYKTSNGEDKWAIVMQDIPAMAYSQYKYGNIWQPHRMVNFSGRVLPEESLSKHPQASGQIIIRSDAGDISDHNFRQGDIVIWNGKVWVYKGPDNSEHPNEPSPSSDVFYLLGDASMLGSAAGGGGEVVIDRYPNQAAAIAEQAKLIEDKGYKVTQAINPDAESEGTTNGYYTLTKKNNWTRKIEGLSEGEYYAIEIDVRNSTDSTNKSLISNYSVTYDYEQDGRNVIITNKKTVGEEIGFAKIDSNGQPISVDTLISFSLYHMKQDGSASGEEAVPITVEGVSTKAATLSENGTVKFVAPGGIYVMKETMSEAANEKFVENKNTYAVLVGADYLTKEKLLTVDDGMYANVFANITDADIKAQLDAQKNATSSQGSGTAEDGRTNGAVDETAKHYAIFLLKDGKAVPTIVADDSDALSGPDIVNYGLMNVLKGERKVILKKVNESDSPLSGAAFVMYNADWSIRARIEKSGTSGVLFIDALPYGTYYLEETEFPNGCERTDGRKYFILKVSESGSTLVDVNGVSGEDETKLPFKEEEVKVNRVVKTKANVNEGTTNSSGA